MAELPDANKAQQAKIFSAMMAYSLCSSTLLLANKTSILHLPRPAIVNSIQIIFSIGFMLCLKLFGIEIDQLEWSKAKNYFVYVAAFTISRYSNMKALQHSNVETVIVFRACAPLAVSVVEYLFMGRSFPSVRTCASLTVVCIGAAVYCYADSEFSVHGVKAYSWVFVYFVLLIFEMTYCKRLTSAAKMRSKWGPVFYCNVLAVIPTLLLAYATGEISNLSGAVADMSIVGYLVILFSCIGGTCIGYVVWIVIDLVSATTYTLVGVVNKFFTGLLNVLLWDKHSTPTGLAAMFICLGASAFYEQAPMRTKRT
ncbi:unnamed protein product [Ectocarpus fasciculatus]